MAEQNRVSTSSIKSNFLELVLKIQDGSHVLVHGIESFVIESMISKVEHNIGVDEKTNECYFVKRSCKDRIFCFATQMKVRNQRD